MKTIQFSIIAFLMTVGMIAATGQPFDLNNIRASAIPQKTNAENQPAALESHLDLRAYGAYATYSSTTATTTSGSAAVVLTAPSNFRNNEFITIYQAGRANTAALPTGLTVTPSVNAGGYTQAVALTGGSTTYGYKIVAEDAYRGRTASTAVASTGTAQASLGMQGVNIRALSRTDNVVTISCASTCRVPVEE